MKVFLDTNIVMEFCCERQQYDLVEHIFIAADDRKIRTFVSPGTIYTMTYLIDQELRARKVPMPQRVERLREAIEALTDVLEVSGFDKDMFLRGLRDPQFLDLEDSYQHQCALAEGCQALVTINIKDFRGAQGHDIEILTPAEFVDKYL